MLFPYAFLMFLTTLSILQWPIPNLASHYILEAYINTEYQVENHVNINMLPMVWWHKLGSQNADHDLILIYWWLAL